MATIALVCSSWNILQMKAKARCRGLSRRYICGLIHIFCRLWDRVIATVGVQKSAHHYILLKCFAWLVTWGPVQPQTWYISLTASLCTTAPKSQPQASLRTWTKVPCAFTLLFWVCSSFIWGVLAKYAPVHPSNFRPSKHFLFGPSCPITSPVFTNSSPGSCFQWHLW